MRKSTPENMINKQKTETRALTITAMLLALSTNLSTGIIIEKNIY
jgi:hypothetical protein